MEARTRQRTVAALVVGVALAGLASLTATALAPRSGVPPRTSGAVLALVEVGLLLALIVVVVRVAPTRRTTWAVAPAVVAVATWVLRIDPPTTAAVLAGCAAWGAAALGAVAVGTYLRALDARRARSVADARRAQRLLLARELHDFVAHDVSEILAQAQAGQVLAADDPRRAAGTLRIIERAAQAALTSMDRTVHLLGDAGDGTAADPPTGRAPTAQGPAAARAPIPGLGDLPDLVARFAASHPGEVRLDLDPTLAGDPADAGDAAGPADPVDAGEAADPADARGAGGTADAADVGTAVPRDVGSTVYRVAVEALTNVRRHAPTAARVDVVVGRAGGDVVVEVTNADARPAAAPAGPSTPPPTPPPRPARAGGLGLPGLADRVRALGGTFEAGRHGPGWQVRAVLPAPRATAGRTGVPAS